MKLHLDVPNQFSVEHYRDHDIIRETYTRVIQAALRVGLELNVERARIFPGELIQTCHDGEIRYAYHADKVGENTYSLKPSALSRFWFFDSCGYSGWAQIALDSTLQKAGENFDLEDSLQFIKDYRTSVAASNLSKLAQSEEPLENEVASLKEFIFFPLQVDADRVLFHQPWEQSDTLRALIKVASTHNKAIVLKRHPLCHSTAIETWLETAANTPNIYLSDGSIHKLIARSSHVLVANSGVGIEALLHGKPVYSMAASEYRHMTQPIHNLSDLETLLTETPPPQSDRIKRQLGFFFKSYLVDSTDTAAIEARLKQHILAHSGRPNKTKAGLEHQVLPSVRQTSLLDRTTNQLANTVEVLLRDKTERTDISSNERIYILAHAASLGIKQNLILKRGGPDVLLKTASLFPLTGETRELAVQFAQAAARVPGYEGRALLLLARAAISTKDMKTALSHLRHSAEYDDASEQTFLSLAQVLLRSGRENTEEANTMAQRALALNPEYTTAFLFLARLEQAQNNPDSALNWFKEAQKRAPDRPDVVKAASVFLKT